MRRKTIERIRFVLALMALGLSSTANADITLQGLVDIHGSDEANGNVKQSYASYWYIAGAIEQYRNITLIETLRKFRQSGLEGEGALEAFYGFINRALMECAPADPEYQYQRVKRAAMNGDGDTGAAFWFYNTLKTDCSNFGELLDKQIEASKN